MSDCFSDLALIVGAISMLLSGVLMTAAFYCYWEARRHLKTVRRELPLVARDVNGRPLKERL
jgi:hypothetical protein